MSDHTPVPPRPHVGIKLPNWGDDASVETITAAATAADLTGFDSVWVSDHIAIPESDDGVLTATTPFYEVLATLAFAGALTHRVQLATGVLVGPLRDPLLLAKQAATVDQLTRGRLVLGLGSGWLEGEFDAMHKDWRGRGRVLNELIETLRAAWGSGAVHVPGVRDGLTVGSHPRPHRPIPLLMGGRSAVALTRAASRADGWYGANLTVSEFVETAEILAGKRDPASAPFAVGVKPALTAAGHAARVVADFADAGADFVVLEVDFGGLDAAGVTAAVSAVAGELGLATHPGRPLRPAGATVDVNQG